MKNTLASPYRSVGWAAISSGAIGIVAFACLITAVTTRTTMVLSQPVDFFFRAHDAGLVLQFLLMIPVILGLQRLSLERPPGLSQAIRNVGIGTLSITSLILMLIIPKYLPDGYYVIAQGVFGLWLMVVCWRLRGTLPVGLRWSGLVVGFGLALLGPIPVALALFAYPESLNIPAVDPATFQHQDTLVNRVLHQVIWVGTLLGVLPFPFWSILLGRKLLRH